MEMVRVRLWIISYNNVRMQIVGQCGVRHLNIFNSFSLLFVLIIHYSGLVQEDPGKRISDELLNSETMV